MLCDLSCAFSVSIGSLVQNTTNNMLRCGGDLPSTTDLRPILSHSAVICWGVEHSSWCLACIPCTRPPFNADVSMSMPHCTLRLISKLNVLVSIPDNLKHSMSESSFPSVIHTACAPLAVHINDDIGIIRVPHSEAGARLYSFPHSLSTTRDCGSLVWRCELRWFLRMVILALPVSLNKYDVY